MPKLLDVVLPYVKAIVPDDGGPAIKLSHRDAFVFRPLVGDLMTTYVLEEQHSFVLVAQRDLDAAKVTAQQVHGAALVNFAARVERGMLQISRNGRIFGLLLDGNFEATLLLYDEMWSQLETKLGAGLAVVAPARDVLAVGKSDDAEAVAELLAVVDRVWPAGDHLLTKTLLKRENGKWRLATKAKRAP